MKQKLFKEMPKPKVPRAIRAKQEKTQYAKPPKGKLRY